MERRGRESVKFYGDHHDCPKGQDRTILMVYLQELQFAEGRAGWSRRQKKGARTEKSVLLISLYLWNYSSNFKILKSLAM
jgi:hypothetical protein